MFRFISLFQIQTLYIQKQNGLVMRNHYIILVKIPEPQRKSIKRLCVLITIKSLWIILTRI